jgi:hypothetical protein
MSRICDAVTRRPRKAFRDRRLRQNVKPSTAERELTRQYRRALERDRATEPAHA